MKRAALLITLTVLTGCTDFPELDTSMGAGARSAAYPRLVPMEGLTAGAQETALDENTGATLAARAAWLRTRAARLSRTQVLSHSERADLRAAIARHPR